MAKRLLQYRKGLSSYQYWGPIFVRAIVAWASITSLHDVGNLMVFRHANYLLGFPITCAPQKGGTVGASIIWDVIVPCFYIR